MKVLVTGSDGFIGKNLLAHLNRLDAIHIDIFTRSDSLESLAEKVTNADFIFHLAGVNRPKDEQEFLQGNRDLTQEIVNIATSNKVNPAILMSSSIQAECDNPYGHSKRAAEKILEKYSEETGAICYLYRLANVFGKWSRPNYNTVIATWCHNITHDIPIQVNEIETELSLVYIDDVVDGFIRHLDDNRNSGVIYPDIFPLYQKSLGEIHELLLSFHESRSNLVVSKVGKGFERALYATYLSFLSEDNFSYALKGYEDERGTFYEFIKTLENGQVSISTTAPGITRGNHYHHTKNEKFLVIKGKASIKLRQIHGDKVIEYQVSDQKMEVVEMIPGYTHDITNTGDSDMVLLLWANELFDRQKPDTYFLEV